ncbi:MAG: arginase family protein, partial [Candidatus Micrarchaeota archaeon]|nr:arginase family protein [Candidatus Micrarchaeota archaeon]
ILPKVNFMGIDLTYEDSRAVIFPAPFSSNSLTEQTLLGPSEILENWNMEDYDLQLSYSPCAAKIYPLPERMYSGEEGLNSIYQTTKKILDDEKFPLVLGGDHTISLATVKAAAEKMREMKEKFSVLIIDAHADMKDKFEGKKYSNLSVTKRLIEEKINVSLLGTRSIGSEELNEAEKINAYCRISTQKEINDFLKEVEDNVYISIDVDAFDPTLMPATPMPEPWGLSWEEVVMPLIKIGEKRNIIGCDITEHAPIGGYKMPSIICAQLAYKIIGIRFRRQAEEENWEEGYEAQ